MKEPQREDAAGVLPAATEDSQLAYILSRLAHQEDINDDFKEKITMQSNNYISVVQHGVNQSQRTNDALAELRKEMKREMEVLRARVTQLEVELAAANRKNAADGSAANARTPGWSQ